MVDPEASVTFPGKRYSTCVAASSAGAARAGEPRSSCNSAGGGEARAPTPPLGSAALHGGREEL